MVGGPGEVRTIWEEHGGIHILDQTALPYRVETLELSSLDVAAAAIRTMQVRGAPLIGATAAWGLALAAREDPSDAGLEAARKTLVATRPTAVNLRWAVDRCLSRILGLPEEDRAEAAVQAARELCETDVDTNRQLGRHALRLLRARAREVDVSAERPLHLLTHCNAGRLATVGWGTATSGIYQAHQEGLPIHVWVDETRPRRQGARLTAWELGQAGVPHTVVPDVAAGHLLATGRVDLVVVGTDRTTGQGDVANKIGTYGVALAARDNGVPFYVAAPGSSIDFGMEDGTHIPIEERGEEEVTWITGETGDGSLAAVQLLPQGSPVANWAFDVTPARLITGIITERGVAKASRESLAALFPDAGMED
ncbi:MAG: S-methyl-5-thioribose-1-phosphate isomerase [Gemmatimonadota bacterium]